MGPIQGRMAYFEANKGFFIVLNLLYLLTYGSHLSFKISEKSVEDFENNEYKVLDPICGKGPKLKYNGQFFFLKKNLLKK